MQIRNCFLWTWNEQQHLYKLVSIRCSIKWLIDKVSFDKKRWEILQRFFRKTSKKINNILRKVVTDDDGTEKLG